MQFLSSPPRIRGYETRFLGNISFSLTTDGTPTTRCVCNNRWQHYAELSLAS